MGDLRVFMFMIMLASLICRQSWSLFLPATFLALISVLCLVLVDLHVWILTPTDGQDSGDAIWLTASPTAAPCQHLALIWSVINAPRYCCACSSWALTGLLQVCSLVLALLWTAWKSSISPCLDTRGIGWGAINMFQREIAHTVFFNRIISCLLYNLSYPLFEIL